MILEKPLGVTINMMSMALVRLLDDLFPLFSNSIALLLS
jgi:hypothetical protein